MKINMNEVTETVLNHYMNMPFDKLVNTIFTKEGDRKQCAGEASIALINRLEAFYKIECFGNTVTGELNELDAYVASTIILTHGDKA